MDNDSVPDDAIAQQFSDERYAAELSPAQPDGASRIDADDTLDADDAHSLDGQTHVKHDRGGRMED